MCRLDKVINHKDEYTEICVEVVVSHHGDNGDSIEVHAYSDDVEGTMSLRIGMEHLEFRFGETVTFDDPFSMVFLTNMHCLVYYTIDGATEQTPGTSIQVDKCLQLCDRNPTAVVRVHGVKYKLPNGLPPLP